jgi:hypothetical protein
LQDPIFPQFAVTGTEVGYPGGRWFNPFSMAATDEKVRTVFLYLSPPWSAFQ